MKLYFEKGKGGKLSAFSFDSNMSALFVPAAFFVILGLLTVLAPRFIIAMIASFFLFLGLLCAVVAWKFMQMRKKVEATLKNFQSKVIVQNVHLRPGQKEDIEVDESKKIVYH